MTTRRIRLDIDISAIENVAAILPVIYNSREPRTRVNFTTMTTQKADDKLLEEVFGQKNSMPIPLFAIRRRSVAYDQSFMLNGTIARRDGFANLRSDTGDVASIKGTHVIYSLDILLFTDVFEVLDHWIKALLMFGGEIQSFGEVRIEDPVFGFPVRGAFSGSYDYPTPSSMDQMSGWVFTVNLDLHTHIIDLEYQPPLREAIVQIEMSNETDYPTKLSKLDSMSASAFANFDPKLSFVISPKLGE